jgi:hypothetical protein
VVQEHNPWQSNAASKSRGLWFVDVLQVINDMKNNEALVMLSDALDLQKETLAILKEALAVLKQAVDERVENNEI